MARMPAALPVANAGDTAGSVSSVADRSAENALDVRDGELDVPGLDL